MSRRGAWILGVVLVVGIIAVGIPIARDVIEAVKRGREKTTATEIRTFGLAIGQFIEERGACPPNGLLEDLELEQHWNREETFTVRIGRNGAVQDAWGNDYFYLCRDGDFLIATPGHDGVYQVEPTLELGELGPGTETGADLIFKNDRFLAWQQGIAWVPHQESPSP